MFLASWIFGVALLCVFALPNTGRRRVVLRRGLSTLTVFAVIFLADEVAVPKLRQAKAFAQKTAALRANRTIHTAEVELNSSGNH